MARRRDNLIEPLERRVMLTVEPLDPTFGAQGLLDLPFVQAPTRDRSEAVALAPDGKVVVAGETEDGAVGLVRYNVDGSIDATFGNQGKVKSFLGGDAELISEVAVQPDGKIVVAGAQDDRFFIARFTAEGRVDIDFAQSGISRPDLFESIAYAVAFTSDGKIIAVGGAHVGQASSSLTGFRVARYNPDGSLDATFGGAGINGPGVVSLGFGGVSGDTATDVALQADGKIVVFGYGHIVRFNADGSIDESFGDHGVAVAFSKDGAHGLAIFHGIVSPGGKIVVAGKRSNGVNSYVGVIARLQSDGSLDQSFGIDGFYETPNLTAHEFVQTLEGGFILGGEALVGVTPEGATDSTFGDQGRLDLKSPSGRVNDIATLPDGRLLISKDNSEFLAARLLPKGAFDSSFAGQGYVTTDFGKPQTIGSEEFRAGLDGQRYVVIKAQLRASLARLRSDGALDTTFRYDDGSDPTRDIIDVRADAEGAFVLRIDSQGRSWLQRLHLDGTPDAAFGPNGQRLGFASGLARIQANGMILTQGGEADAPAIVRLNVDGTRDLAYGDQGAAPLPAGFPLKMNLQSDGSLLVLGERSGPDGPVSWLTRLRPDGSLDTMFGESGFVSLTADGFLFSGSQTFTIGADGQIIVSCGAQAPGQPAGYVLYAFDPFGRPAEFGTNGRFASPATVPGFRATYPAAVAIRPDGSIFVGGYVVDGSNTGPTNLGFIEGYASDGSLLRSFGVDGRIVSTKLAAATDLVAEQGGDLIVAGLGFDLDVKTRRNPAVAHYLTNSVLSIHATEIASTELATPGYATTGSFIIERSGDLSKPLDLQYSLGGTATLGLDYELPADSRVIPAGADSITIDVRAIDDAQSEGDETVRLSLDAVPDGYQLLQGRGASVTIEDNDALDRFEPNDSFSSAMPLALNTTESGLTLHRTGDEDYYRLRSAQGGWEDIQLTFNSLFGSVSLEAFDAQSNSVARSFPSGAGVGDLHLKMTAGQDYYLRATGPANPGYQLSTVYAPFASIVGRFTYYRGVQVDGGPFTINADDRRVAGDKVALAPGDSPSYANITDFTDGITGVMIDFSGLKSWLGDLDVQLRALSRVDGDQLGGT